MNRTARIVVGIVLAVVALNVLLSVVHSLLGGTPGGPGSSSYATGADGVAAYAALLAERGHPVAQVRATPAKARLGSGSTVLLLDPDRAVAATDAAALRRFVVSGGRLVLGGASGPWLRRILPGGPTWVASPAGPDDRVLAPLAALEGVRTVDAPGAGAWVGGSALPALGAHGQSVLAFARLGRGQVWLLADTAPLQDRLLAKRDDAALGLALAGPAGRPALFLESYHGYGTAGGFAAIPARWWLAFALLFAAAVVLMLASVRRLGPAEPLERQLAPARAEYVEALAGVLARTRAPEQAAAPLRSRLAGVLARRGGLGEDASPAALAAAARLLGASEPEAELLTRPVRSEAELVALGRALARIQRESPR